MQTRQTGVHARPEWPPPLGVFEHRPHDCRCRGQNEYFRANWILRELLMAESSIRPNVLLAIDAVGYTTLPIPESVLERVYRRLVVR